MFTPPPATLPLPQAIGPYGVLVFIGILISAIYWIRSSRGDHRLFIVYAGALGGAFIGAKLAFILAEGWLLLDEPNWWQYWLIGKSITGALLGGFAGVEAAKKLIDYTEPTGDRFALIIPLGIAAGRVGCLTAGCCPGILLSSGSHWPAVPVELGFNLVLWVILFSVRHRPWAKNQLFHIFLIAYGTFRFFHEFLRATPKILGPVSGYQVIALCIAIVGIIAFRRRRNHTA